MMVSLGVGEEGAEMVTLFQHVMGLLVLLCCWTAYYICLVSFVIVDVNA